MKQKKENLYIFILLVIAILPNVISYFLYSGKGWLFLMTLSLMILLLPALFFKKKVWLWIVFVFVLLSPFEISTLLSTNARINNVIIASIFLTSKEESTEFLSAILPAVFFSVGLIILYLFIFKKIKSNSYLDTKYRIGILIFSILIVLYQFMTVSVEKDNFSLRSKQTIASLKAKLSYSVYPSDLILNTVIYVKATMIESNAMKNLEHFSLGAQRNNNKPQVTILVIGETSRAANWSLFGYEKETNPKLRKEEGIYPISNTYSSANSTYRSIPMLITQSTPQNYDEWKRTGTISRAFKESGNYTAWIGGQSEAHMFVHLAATKSDFVDYAKGYDGKLFEKAKMIVTANKQNVFIVIHIFGSHFNYNQRYPKEFNYFKPSDFTSANLQNKKEMINAYDNTVLYTDFLLDDFIQFLKKDNRNSALYYTADHGENLMDDKKNLMFHAAQHIPTSYEFHVPTFVWLSESYRRDYPEKVENLIRNKDKKMSTTVTYHSVIDLGNIGYPNENKKRSVFSQSFEEFKKRFAYTNLKEVIQID